MTPNDLVISVCADCKARQTYLFSQVLKSMIFFVPYAYFTFTMSVNILVKQNRPEPRQNAKPKVAARSKVIGDIFAYI